LYNSPSLAINITLIVALGNVILVLASFALTAIEDTCIEYSYIKPIIMLFPPFAFGDGIWRVATLAFLPTIDRACEALTDPDNFDTRKLTEEWTALEWRVIGPHLTYMLVMAPCLLLLAVAVDFVAATPALQLLVCKVFLRDTKTQRSDAEADPDVAAEALHALESEESKRTDVVRVLGLRRAYGLLKPKLAVQDLKFGIRHGECFGLLGVNGAGKSTTMKMLTADVLPTSGTAMLGGYDILKQQYEVRQLLGYCPQTNPLLPLVTVMEHLRMFGRIKGIKEADLEDVCMRRMEELSLLPFKNKRAGNLSGGNKRKLCVAIALIGDPLVIFLDEPSAGMDPVAKRHMWDLISSMSATVVLTTHLMEEASALCDRITIMVDGRFRCLGTEQELKNKHGDGHELSFKLRNPTEKDLAPLLAAIDAVLDANGFTPIAVVEGGGTSSARNVMRADLENVCDALERLCAPKVVASSTSIAFAPTSAPRLSDLLGETEGDAVSSSALLQAAALDSDGFLHADSIAAWWIRANWFDAIDRFLGANFPRKILLEKHESIVRYRLPAEKKQEGNAGAAGVAAEEEEEEEEEEEDAAVVVTTDAATMVMEAAVIIVPDGVDEGANISVTTPSGTVVEIVRPEGVESGHAAALQLPAAVMHAVVDRDAAPLGLGQTFGMLERKKEELNVLEYAVGQTTLQQIFMRFAQQQIDVQLEKKKEE
jgi:ATP-binding cassette subfamily A (ABC1) protein 1